MIAHLKKGSWFAKSPRGYDQVLEIKLSNQFVEDFIAFVNN